MGTLRIEPGASGSWNKNATSVLCIPILSDLLSSALPLDHRLETQRALRNLVFDQKSQRWVEHVSDKYKSLICFFFSKKWSKSFFARIPSNFLPSIKTVSWRPVGCQVNFTLVVCWLHSYCLPAGVLCRSLSVKQMDNCMYRLWSKPEKLDGNCSKTSIK